MPAPAWMKKTKCAFLAHFSAQKRAAWAWGWQYVALLWKPTMGASRSAVTPIWAARALRCGYPWPIHCPPRLPQRKPMQQAAIHIVDDDPDVRDGLAWLFDSRGYVASTWDSGLAFLDAA